MRDCAEPARKRAHDMVEKHGYARGGHVHSDAAQEKALIKKAIREHENAEHDGHHEHLKLKNGGKVEGNKAGDRPDRRARGGAHHGKSTVNVIVGGNDPAKEQMAARAGLQQGIGIGAKAEAQKMAGAGVGPRPPMAAPAGGPPPGAAPRPPMGPPPGAPAQMAKDGGKIKVRSHERRRSGGSV